jgi:phytol kinase
MHPVLAIIITLACLGTIILLSTWGLHTGKLSGEFARKSVHVGMGVICLSFPWLFDSPLPVQILAAAAILTLFCVRITRLRQSIGSALFSIDRLSIGELLFPLAVAWLFTLAQDKPLHYCISLLLLTLADTAGALAGAKYGKKIYHTTAATKSLEGSIAFFVTAFICTSLPLYFFANLPLIIILFLSFTIALFTMAVEGASGHGLDNLLIPLGAFLLLDYYTGLSSYAIFLRSVVLLALLTILLTTHRKHTFDGGAILTSMLFGFATFTLGGTACLICVLILFSRHIISQHFMPKECIVTHSTDVIIAIAIPSLFWLTLGREELIAPNIAQFGFISTLALIIAMLYTGTQKHMEHNTSSLLTALALTTITLTPALSLDVPLSYFIPTLLLTTPLARFYFHWRTGPDDPAFNHWLKLGLLASIASPIAMLPILL